MSDINKIWLEPFTEEDIENKTYLKWFYDTDVTKYNSHGLFPYTKKQKQDFLESLNKNVVFKIIVDYKDYSNNLWIGNISLQSINWINRSAEIAIIIGNIYAWGKNVGTRAFIEVIKHGFNKLNLNRIWTGTAATNTGMRKVAEKSGMKEEGKFREGMYLHGNYVDIICYSILRKEFDSNNVHDINKFYEEDKHTELGFDTNIGE